MKFLIIAFILGPFFIQDTISAEINNNTIPTDISPLRFKYGNHTINKPLFHFSPDYGWMNDPNGCWYDKANKIYHLYFQYNPSDTIWAMPLYWGHAVSKNLMLWEQKDIAIAPVDGKSGAYSGSIFIDEDNLFQDFFFYSNGSDRKTSGSLNNVIAAWTYTDSKWLEYQYLSYSLDDGYTFRTPLQGSFENYVNPVGIIGNKETKEYRDPQVIKVAKSTYIMSVARSHDYEIYFLKSNSTSHDFNKIGSFGIIGYLGYQYECPNLVHLKCKECKSESDEEEATGKYTEGDYWVLFISINPGSIQGGSSTQYFIGTFEYEDNKIKDGEPFTPIDRRTTVIDYGKDFYAMQLFFQSPDMTSEGIAQPFDSAKGIGWASNWQYTALVPTDPWRSSMSIPRQIKLKFYQPADSELDKTIYDPSPFLLYVAQKPLLEDYIFDDTFEKVTQFSYKDGDKTIAVDPSDSQYNKRYKLESGKLYHVDLNEGAYGALEFELEYGIYDAYSNDNPGVLTLYLNGSSIPEEYLRIGHNNKADAFFIDRGHTNVQWCHENPFFTDKVSVNIYKKDLDKFEDVPSTDGTDKNKYYQIFSVHGIIDRNIIELFFNEDENDDNYSIITSTNTFFFTGGNFIGSIDFKVNQNSKDEKGELKEGGYVIRSFSARQLVPKDDSNFQTIKTNRRLENPVTTDL